MAASMCRTMPGASWHKTNDDRNLRQRAFYYTHIFADPVEKDTVYVLNVSFFKSTDGGKTFPTQIRPPHGDNHDLWIAPNDNKRMIQANDGGGNVSVNGGQSWSDQDFPTGQFYNAYTTKHVPYQVCGAQQDNTTACVGAARGDGDGDGTPPIFYAVGGGESGYIAPDPTNTNVFFAGSYGGYLTRFDRSTGQQRDVNIYPNNPMGWSSVDITERFQWTFPIVFANTDPKTLYASSQHLWKTSNGGQTWQRISPNLTRSDPKTMQASGGPITKDQTGVETYAVIFTIAPSFQDGNTIWTGSDDGVVHVTRDGGTNWDKVTPPDLPDFTRISLIEASPHQNGVAYLAGNRYQQGDRRPYVFKTADFGRTWQKIVNGIPDGDFARAIREDPARRGLLYLGTETGIYISFNDGANWQPLRLNLPVTPVHGIVVEKRDLVIGTHGRGFYVLDDINVLRQATPDVTTNALFLFQPNNPLRGLDTNISIDYYLGKDAEEVKIDFLDASGAVLRSFTGRAGEKPETPAGGDNPFGYRPPRVPVGKGMNRLTWDLRQEGAVVFPGMIMWAAQPQRGPASPPGKYSVRIAANGETKSREFDISRRSAARRRRRQRSRAARAVQVLHSGARSRHRGQHGGAAHPRRTRSDQRAHEECPGAAPRRDSEARRRGADAADGGGGGDLSGPQPQQPGSAELSDSAEQQDCGADGRDRELGQSSDRSDACGLQGTVRRAREAAGTNADDREERPPAAQCSAEAGQGGCGQSRREACTAPAGGRETAA